MEKNILAALSKRQSEHEAAKEATRQWEQHCSEWSRVIHECEQAGERAAAATDGEQLSEAIAAFVVAAREAEQIGHPEDYQRVPLVAPRPLSRIKEYAAQWAGDENVLRAIVGRLFQTAIEKPKTLLRECKAVAKASGGRLTDDLPFAHFAAYSIAPPVDETTSAERYAQKLDGYTERMQEAFAGAMRDKGEVDEWIGPYSPTEWQKKFDVSQTEFYRMRKAGRVRVRKITTRKLKIHRDDVAAFSRK